MAILAVAHITLLHPTPQPNASASERLALWAKWNVPRALCAVAHIQQVAIHRFNSAEDVPGALTVGSARVKLLQAMLQNTLEQLVVAVLASGGFAVLAPSRWLVLVPVYSLLFVLGRLLFVLGYSGGAPSRAAGFALTYMPSLIMLGLSLA